MPEVYCTVNTCQYYQHGNKCTANKIVIQSDNAGGHSSGEQLSQLSVTPAETNDATCCQTFIKYNQA